MMKRIKWFIEDLRDMFRCLLLYRWFAALKEGCDHIHIQEQGRTREYIYCGMNRYGFSDGMLPQYSVIIRESDGLQLCHEISPKIVSFIRKESIAN